MRRAVSCGTHCTPVIVVHLRQELGPLSPDWATPVALAVGCRKCPIFNVCPAKSVIGDYKPDDAAAAPKRKRAAKAAPKR